MDKGICPCSAKKQYQEYPKQEQNSPDTGTKEMPDMADKKTMTPEEKALLQAKHRLEAVQARDRKKERNARTRRLILEGAELEYVVPEVREMSREELRHFLSFHLQKHD